MWKTRYFRKICRSLSKEKVVIPMILVTKKKALKLYKGVGWGFKFGLSRIDKIKTEEATAEREMTNI